MVSDPFSVAAKIHCFTMYMTVHIVGDFISSVLPESNLFEYSLGSAVFYKYLERVIFPDQAASDADLTATSKYFFRHILTKKKKKALDFGIFFCTATSSIFSNSTLKN